MLVTCRELLNAAGARGYAVGAFNINNLESLLAITEASGAESSPVIVAATPSAIRYAGLEHLAAMVKTAEKSVSVPMALHLDHGRDVETVSKCIGMGFTSVMIDASHLDIEENISLTRHVVGLAHPKSVSVEAELGRLAGVEESTVEEKEAILTSPDAAKEFVERTNVDALAVAIGTSHGAYKFRAKPQLDFERLEAIRKMVEVPLVLHGASGVPSWIVEKAKKYGTELGSAKGIPDEQIRRAISLGITKINIDTDLRLAFVGAIREILVTSPKQFDPRKILGPAKEAMKELVRRKMRLFGSSSKHP